jgi:hypothetical protein
VQEKMLFHVQYRSESQQVHFCTQEQQFYPHLREAQNPIKTEEKYEQQESCEMSAILKFD